MTHTHTIFWTHREKRNGTALCHIANAVHVPAGSAEIPATLNKYRERPVVVYCQRGQRSIAFCNKLSKQGFESVYNLKGGVLAWQKAELPLTKNN